MVMVINIPPRNCFQKFRPSEASGKNHCDSGCAQSQSHALSTPSLPKSTTSTQMSTPSMAAVCRVSVNTTARIPPRWVYIQIKARTATTVAPKGSPKGSATRSCKMVATKNRRSDEPTQRESKKNQAPVR